MPERQGACQHPIILPDFSISTERDRFHAVCVACDVVLERVPHGRYLPTGMPPSHWIDAAALETLGVNPERFTHQMQLLIAAAERGGWLREG